MNQRQEPVLHALPSPVVAFGVEVRHGLNHPVVELGYGAPASRAGVADWAVRLAAEDVRWWVLRGIRKDDPARHLISINAQLATEGLTIAWKTPLFACVFEAAREPLDAFADAYARRGAFELRLRVEGFAASLLIPWEPGKASRAERSGAGPGPRLYRPLNGAEPLW